MQEAGNDALFVQATACRKSSTLIRLSSWSAPSRISCAMASATAESVAWFNVANSA